jgi:hypothetical protein
MRAVRRNLLAMHRSAPLPRGLQTDIPRLATMRLAQRAPLAA